MFVSAYLVQGVQPGWVWLERTKHEIFHWDAGQPRLAKTKGQSWPTSSHMCGWRRQGTRWTTGLQHCKVAALQALVVASKHEQQHGQSGIDRAPIWGHATWGASRWRRIGRVAHKARWHVEIRRRRKEERGREAARRSLCVSVPSHHYRFFKPNKKLEWTQPYKPNRRQVQPILKN